MADQPVDAPGLLTAAHDLNGFQCGEAALDDWLRRRAWHNLQTAASRTYVICPARSLAVIGYVTLSMGHLVHADVAGAMRRNMPQFIPAVILGRLAIDRGWHGRGLGRALLADAVNRARRAAAEVAARLLVVHPISPAAAAFYRRHGFVELPSQTPALALDLAKFERLTANP